MYSPRLIIYGTFSWQLIHYRGKLTTFNWEFTSDNTLNQDTKHRDCWLSQFKPQNLKFQLSTENLFYLSRVAEKGTYGQTEQKQKSNPFTSSAYTSHCNMHGRFETLHYRGLEYLGGINHDLGVSGILITQQLSLKGANVFFLFLIHLQIINCQFIVWSLKCQKTAQKAPFLGDKITLTYNHSSK